MSSCSCRFAIIGLATWLVAVPASSPAQTGPEVRGRVTDAPTGAAILNAYVQLFDSQGGSWMDARTDVDGYCVFRTQSYKPLPPGTYFVYASAAGHVGQLYAGLDCPNLNCSLTAGTPVHVGAAIVSDVNLPLARGGGVSGRVTDATTGQPLAGVSIRAVAGEPGLHGYSTTSDDGTYVIAELVTGSYSVSTSYADPYLDEVHPGVVCPEQGCHGFPGTPIPVTIGTLTGGIDFALTTAGRVAGRVVDGTNGSPLGGIDVWIHQASGAVAGTAVTDRNGLYLVDRLRTGSYFARTSSRPAFTVEDALLHELYDGLPCPILRPWHPPLSAGSSRPPSRPLVAPSPTARRSRSLRRRRRAASISPCCPGVAWRARW